MVKTRALKGTILSIWIALLIFVAILASSGEVSRTTNEFFADLLLQNQCNSLVNPTPGQLLTAYLGHFQHPPPIEFILDRLSVNPLYQQPKNGHEIDRSAYLGLFSKLALQLRSICTSPVPNSKLTEIEVIIPPALGGDGKPQKVHLTPEIETWIDIEKTRIEKQKQLESLIDTFVMLIVLGGFGSIIFLTRDFIGGKNDVMLSAYFFRPILGAFLGVAMFIIDIVAHSVVSTADILKVRHETLFVLALAAGLLSDHAYDLINVRAKMALDKWGKKSEEAQENKEHVDKH